MGGTLVIRCRAATAAASTARRSPACSRLTGAGGAGAGVRGTRTAGGAGCRARCWVLRARAAVPAVLCCCCASRACCAGWCGFPVFRGSGVVRAGRVAGGGVFGCAGSRLVPWVVRAGDWSLVENCTVDASICGQVFKGARWMPWYQEPMKDAGGRDRPRGAVNRAVIRGCPNGETRQPSWAVTRC